MESGDQETQYGDSNVAIIPVAFLIAVVLIAGAFVYRGRAQEGGVTTTNQVAEEQEEFSLRGLQETDHVRGNPNARVSLIEFSDFECPFCAQLHPTLARLVDENPDVNWVYRHFPLTSIHSEARDAAVASECVARLGGNDAFWEFTDQVFESKTGLSDELYEEIATGLGIEKAPYEACLSDRSVVERVFTDLNEAISAGGRGTPFSVVIAEDGTLFPFSGALRYETIRDLVDTVLTQ